MPTYTYKCANCGTFDWVHPINESLGHCPKCGEADFSKVFNSVGIAFKGSGFYTTDSRGK